MAGLERTRERVAKQLLALVEGRAQVGIAHSERPVLEQQHDEVALLAHQAPQAVAHRTSCQRLGRRRLGETHQLACRTVDALLEQRDEELELAVEVPVDRPARQARAPGDRLQRGAFIATFAQLGKGGVEQSLPGRAAELGVAAVAALGG